MRLTSFGVRSSLCELAQTYVAESTAMRSWSCSRRAASSACPDGAPRSPGALRCEAVSRSLVKNSIR